MGRTIKRVNMAAVRPAEKAKRVAAYARVSCGKDAMLHSLSAQVSYYSGLIQKTPGWEYAGVYADEAVSGTKNSRGEFQKMLAECRAGNIDLIITKSISRFARNTVTTLKTIRELWLIGVDVYFEEQNIHTLGEDGEFVLTLLAAYAEEEARSVSENIKWKVNDNFRQGRIWSTVMYGYRIRDGRLEVVPEEAEMLRKAARLYLDGGTQEDLRKMFADAGAYGRHGKEMNGCQILDLLCNEKTAGNLLLQKTYVADPITKDKRKNGGELQKYFVEGSHEAILDAETYGKVVAERERRLESHICGKGHYPFSSRITCGHCGKNFVRHPLSKDKYEWVCRVHSTRGTACCPMRGIAEEMLERLTAEAMGLPVFDGGLFQGQVAGISVPAEDQLVYHFYDGHTVTKTWARPRKRLRRFRKGAGE
nr:recombinase family protein [uncultured Acetatifactor sp.]